MEDWRWTGGLLVEPWYVRVEKDEVMMSLDE